MFEIIKQDILKYFFMYIGQGSRLAAIAFFLSFLVLGWYAGTYGEGRFFGAGVWFKAFVTALLTLYVYTVIGITLLSRTSDPARVVNLRLFSSFDSTVVDPRYVYENLLLFVPFGILLYLLADLFRHAWVMFLVGFLCSLAIEVVQLVTGLGCFILDDILTNVTGMMAAYLVCRLLDWRSSS